jgi:hypothetical protein
MSLAAPVAPVGDGEPFDVNSKVNAEAPVKVQEFSPVVSFIPKN